MCSVLVLPSGTATRKAASLQLCRPLPLVIPSNMLSQTYSFCVTLLSQSSHHPVSHNPVVLWQTDSSPQIPSAAQQLIMHAHSWISVEAPNQKELVARHAEETEQAQGAEHLRHRAQSSQAGHEAADGLQSSTGCKYTEDSATHVNKYRIHVN